MYNTSLHNITWILNCPKYELCQPTQKAVIQVQEHTLFYFWTWTEYNFIVLRNWKSMLYWSIQIKSHVICALFGDQCQGKILINSPKTEISFCWHVLVNVDGSGALSHHQIRIEHCFEAWCCNQVWFLIVCSCSTILNWKCHN